MDGYKDVLVTYLDILGFSELVKHRTSEEILDVLKLMKEKTNFHRLSSSFSVDSVVPKQFSQSHAFSDLVIRQVEFDERTFASRLGSEMAVLAKIQFELLTTRRCTLIRGGISRGNCCLSNDFVFGPAMVRSYELEKLAVFPRILIDRDLIKEISAGNRKRWDYLIRCGEDGMFFIDYLNGVTRNASFLPPNEVIKNKRQLLFDHMKATENKLEGLSTKEESVRQKGLWLAQYHNRVVEQAMANNKARTDVFSQLLIAKHKLI